MAINYAKLRNQPDREHISALIRDGFVFVRQAGAHQHYSHPDRRRETV
ncbi:MAG: type II toxin-antitoxin system HicA family toxin, partial [Bryobacteraceae bacterium]